jgi:hypothetical protein
MIAFRDNQQAGLQAWMQTAADITSGTSGAKTFEDAVTLFWGHFGPSSAQTAVKTQFQTCPGYDSAVNNWKKIAGTRGVFVALDPCFCSAFCQDVVDATTAHEREHLKYNLGSLSFFIDALAACKTGLPPASFCDELEPLQITISEIRAYTVGIQALNDAIKALQDKANAPIDDAGDTLSCTSDTDGGTPEAGLMPMSFPGRVRALVNRMVYGATR